MADGCSANGGKGPCSTICLPKPYGKYTCRCDTGVLLKSDNRTCSDGRTFIFILNISIQQKHYKIICHDRVAWNDGVQFDNLTHMCISSQFWDLAKQCRPRSKITEVNMIKYTRHPLNWKMTRPVDNDGWVHLVNMG